MKIIAGRKSDRILGAHIVGPQASDMIAELVLAIEFGHAVRAAAILSAARTARTRTRTRRGVDRREVVEQVHADRTDRAAGDQ